MRNHYFLSLLLTLIAFWNVEAKEREISKVSAPTYVPGNPPLAKPTEVAADFIDGSGTTLVFYWRDNTTTETKFQIAISTDGVNFSENWADANVGVYGTKVLGGLTPNTKYWFAVRAVEEAGGPTDFSSCTSSITVPTDNSADLYSCWSDIIEVTSRPNLPFAPANVIVANGWTQTSATLVFDDVSTDEDRFLIQRKIGGGGWVDLVEVPTNSKTGTGRMTYVDNTLWPNSEYQYRVFSVNASGYSIVPGVGEIFYSLPNPPATPLELKSDWQTLTQIHLLFWDVADNEDNYEIERSVDGSNFHKLTDWPKDMGYFTDENLTEGGTYFYRVRAKNRGGYSGYSNVIQVSTKKRVGPPAHYDLQAKSVSPKQIDLNWSNPLFGQYDVPGTTEIYRSSISETEGYVVIGYLEPERFLFSDTTGSPKVKYWYKLVSTNEFGRSPYSNIATATTLGPPSAPSNLTATSAKDSLSNDIIVTRWVDNSDDEGYFVIERATDADFTQNLLTATLLANYTAATSIPFEEGVTYYYRAKAGNKYGESKYSEVTSITTAFTGAPNKPYALKASATSTAVSLKWGDDSNKEASFEIERSTDGTTFTALGTTQRNITTYVDNTVTANTKYWYRVKAVNPSGSSDYSGVAAVTTPVATGGLAGSSFLVTDEVWQVYPNPTTDGVKVTLPTSMQNKAAFISVIDRMNREVIRTQISSNQSEYRLDLSNFAEGTYTISIRTADQQISKRVYKF